MFLLRFTFENHKSFRDEVDLTLVLPSMKTNVPKDGTWVDNTNRIAAIYGANASGKSCVVDALRYMHGAVEHSAAGWEGRSALPRAPFALDEESRKRPSSFVLDFVLDGVRHEYGFSITRKRIEEEWLYTFPTGRRRVLFERGIGEKLFDFGRELGGGGAALARLTGKKELLLSNAPYLKHPVLTPVHTAIVEGIDIARFGEEDRENRLRSVLKDVADGSLSMENLRTMLRVADIGITDAELEEKEFDAEDPEKFFRAIVEVGKCRQGRR